jgi:BASS family bile acid:Na+ symporter
MFDWYPQYEYLLASTQLALAMLGMGALLAPKDFAQVVRSPRALAVGLGVQLIAAPLVAFGLGRVLPIEAGIAAGLVLVAAVPGGTMSNVVTYLGRGNIALSIALTAVTTVGALVTTPLLLRVFVGDFLPPNFEMPVARVAWEIGITLLLPLAAGMLFGMRFPEWRGSFSKWAIRGSIGVIVIMVVGSAGSGRVDPEAIGSMGIFSILALTAVCQGVAWLGCLAARLDAPDRTAVVIEATIRNINLAVLVKASLFPAELGKVDPIGDGMFVTALMYGGFAFLFATPPVLLARRRTASVDSPG